MNNFISRSVFPALQTSLREPYISLILGPRQTGKTTLLQLLIKDLKDQGSTNTDIVFLTFDDPEWRRVVSKQPERFWQHLEQSYGQPLSALSSDRPKFLFLDEAQKAPAVFDLVKLLFDQHREALKIFLTGSSSLQLYKKSAETLAGRLRTTTVSALSWSEIMSARGYQSLSFISRLPSLPSYHDILFWQTDIYQYRNELKEIWNRYVRSGGLPEIFLLPNQEEQSAALKNYIATYLEKDIRALPQVRDKDLFLETLRTFLLADGTILNLAGLSQTSGIPRLTLGRYLQILEDTLLVKTLDPYVRPTKQAVKSPKIYFFDHGLINYRRGLYTLDQIQASETWGVLFENIIINNTWRAFVNNPEPPSLHFWRDYQDHEIDLVLKTADSLVPVEITVSSHISRAKRLNFKAFFEAFPEVMRGYIVWGGELEQFSLAGKEVIAVPYWLWM